MYVVGTAARDGCEVSFDSRLDTISLDDVTGVHDNLKSYMNWFDSNSRHCGVILYDN